MKNNKKETFWAYLCSAPSLLLILLIVVFPILYTAYISFTNMNVYHWFNFSFVGLKNYKDALFVFDSGFFVASAVSVAFGAFVAFVSLVVSDFEPPHALNPITRTANTSRKLNFFFMLLNSPFKRHCPHYSESIPFMQVRKSMLCSFDFPSYVSSSLFTDDIAT